MAESGTYGCVVQMMLFCHMPVLKSTYKPPFYFRNGHVSTLYPALFRKVDGVEYNRERLVLADGDFVDLDWSKKGFRRLIILSHGLEGSSGRGYMRGMAQYMNARNWDVMAWNCRSCSGEMNLLPRFYHHADIYDLGAVITHALSTGIYDEVLLAGFSMGGSMILNYLGTHQEDIDPRIVGATVYSVPVKMRSSVDALGRKENKIYRKRFLRKLEQKVRLKEALFPGVISAENWDEITHFPDFDNRYTAPLHGFKDADDFYETASALFRLDGIRRPTLLVNALNDPFLGDECYPESLCQKLNEVYYEAPDYGGHVGFPLKGGLSYMEVRTNQFYNEIIRKDSN